MIFGLTDLNGVSIGRLHWATERKVSIPLNGLPVASFTIRLDDPLANSITSRNGDVLLKVYQNPTDSTPTFIGDCTSIEESATDQSATLACNFAGPFWRLQKRLIGKTAPGGTYSPFTASSTDALDATFTTMLAAVNTEKDTGIRPHATFGPLHTAAVSYDFTPVAEVITATQAAKVPYPLETPPVAVTIGQDDFTQGAGNLVGTVDDSGNTWAGSPSTPSANLLTSDASTYVAYSTVGLDSSDYATGRFAVNGSANQTRVVVGCDFKMNYNSAGLGISPYSVSRGMFTRYTDSTHWLAAILINGDHISANGYMRLYKRVGATQTVISDYTMTGAFFLLADTWYSCRLIVDEDGYYFWWVWDRDIGFDSGGVLAEGRDTDLATGGALPTGKSGIFDHYQAGAVSPTLSREYDNFKVATYTGPMSFDFETVPVEPVASTTYQADGLKIAELKIAQPNIGTDRPDAIFEYGTGGRSVKSYLHVTQKEGHLCNEAYSLPQTFPPDTGATQVDVRKATDAASITAHGLFQEVVQLDVGKNSLLRQAWVDANVAVRKDAKHTVTFQPSQNAPAFGTDYFVGDTVRARAVVTVNGVQETRFNGVVRVYGVDITIDENGKEEIVPDLVAEN